MVDFVQSVAVPPTGAYAPALLNFSPLANLPNDYAQGQKNQFDQQQRQRELQLQQPVTANDPRAMALELAKRDPSMAAQLLPFMLGQEPGQVSPLLGGGQPPQGGTPSAPQAGAGAPSAAPAPTAPPARPGSPVGGILPGGAQIMGGDPGAGTAADAGTGQIAQMVAGIQPDPQKAAPVIANIAKSVGAGAAPLTPEQQSGATRRLQAYAQRNGLTSAAPSQGGDATPPFDRRWAAGGSGGEPGSRILHPEPAQSRPTAPGGQQAPAQAQRQPQAEPAAAPIPGMILPPGFKPGQEADAVQALLAEGAKFIASPNARTRAEGEMLLNRAAEIEKKLQPRIVGGNLVDPRGEVIYSATSGNARDIADGIKAGEQPPTTTGLGRMAPQVRGILAKDGFNLAKATQEWTAAQKQIQSLNGPQMTRYAGLANSVVNTIDEVKSLAGEMDNIGVPLLNKIKIGAYIQAEGNSEKGQLAARYLAGINTLKEEFANLAQGGYAPTESAWGLAEQQINGNYGVKELNASLDEVQRLIKYRIQGIPNFSTLGPAAPGNRYFGQGAGGQPAEGAPAATATQAPGKSSAPALAPGNYNWTPEKGIH